jgi:hypothetical protein
MARIQTAESTRKAWIGQLMAWGWLASAFVLTDRPVLAQSIMLLADPPVRQASFPGSGIDAADDQGFAPVGPMSIRSFAAQAPSVGAESVAEQRSAGLPGMATPSSPRSGAARFDPSLARPRIRPLALPTNDPLVPLPIGAAGADPTGSAPGNESVRMVPRPVRPQPGVPPSVMPRPMVGPPVGTSVVGGSPRPLPLSGRGGAGR